MAIIVMNLEFLILNILCYFFVSNYPKWLNMVTIIKTMLLFVELTFLGWQLYDKKKNGSKMSFVDSYLLVGDIGIEPMASAV